MSSRKQLPSTCWIDFSKGENFVRAQGTCGILPVQGCAEGAELDARGERR